jgi:hypothetical protein
MGAADESEAEPVTGRPHEPRHQRQRGREDGRDPDALEHPRDRERHE